MGKEEKGGRKRGKKEGREAEGGGGKRGRGGRGREEEEGKEGEGRGGRRREEEEGKEGEGRGGRGREEEEGKEEEGRGWRRRRGRGGRRRRGKREREEEGGGERRRKERNMEKKQKCVPFLPLTYVTNNSTHSQSYAGTPANRRTPGSSPSHRWQILKRTATKWSTCCGKSCRQCRSSVPEMPGTWR